MKTNWKKFTSLVCALVMLTCTLAACATPTENPSAGTDATEPPAAANTETPTTGDDVTQPESDPYATAGSVSIAYPEAEIAEIQPVLEAFRTQYPNIEVVEVPFAGSTGGAFNEFLTQQAAANDMPDLMWLDWNDFAPQVASGYVMPLNELMENDPEAAYVPSGMTDPYTYGGKLYALPCQMNAMGITMNLDMLEELNIEKPSYYSTAFVDWQAQILSAYRLVSGTLDAVRGSRIAAHDCLANGVVRVSYENGVRIYINYTDTPKLADGRMVEAGACFVDGRK